MITIVGLGNPGETYEHTRHNAGRMAVYAFRSHIHGDEWILHKKANGEVSSGVLDRHEVYLLLPDTFMNRSGVAVAALVPRKKAYPNLVVVHDDLDLPLGTIKISYERGDGGHRGVASIIKTLGTTAFVRIRIGVFRGTKKPTGENAVVDFLLGRLSSHEEATLAESFTLVNEALSTIILEGYGVAMNRFNGGTRVPTPYKKGTVKKNVKRMGVKKKVPTKKSMIKKTKKKSKPGIKKKLVRVAVKKKK